MNKKIIYGVVFAGLAATAGSASAAITSLTTIDFQAMAVDSYGGKPNLSGTSTAGMYTEDGMRIGIVNDPLDFISHLHRRGPGGGGVIPTLLQYHSDSSGIYMRASDNTAFSLQSLDFHSPYDAASNPHTVGGLGDGNASSDYWHIYGFSDARNPLMLTNEVAANGYTPTDPNGGFPTNPAVAHATVVNGTNKLGLNLLSPEPGDLLSLDGSFGNIKSLWIHYNGYPHSPNAYVDTVSDICTVNCNAYKFGLEVDNIKLNAPVPVPAAVWMFLSGMIGLLALGRKKSSLTA